VRDKNIYFKTLLRRLDSWEYELITRLLNKNEYGARAKEKS